MLNKILLGTNIVATTVAVLLVLFAAKFVTLFSVSVVIFSSSDYDVALFFLIVGWLAAVIYGVRAWRAASQRRRSPVGVPVAPETPLSSQQ